VEDHPGRQYYPLSLNQRGPHRSGDGDRGEGGAGIKRIITDSVHSGGDGDGGK